MHRKDRGVDGSIMCLLSASGVAWSTKEVYLKAFDAERAL